MTLSDVGQVAVFDATNTTAERRELLVGGWGWEGPAGRRGLCAGRMEKGGKRAL